MRLAVLFALFVCAGCGMDPTPHPLLGDTPINKNLPDDFRRRVLWTQTDILKYNLEQLVGHVIYSGDSPGTFERGPRYVGQGSPPAVKAIEGGTVYHSKINSEAAVQGSYLVFAAELKANQIADVAIIDTAQALILYENLPIEQLQAEAAKPKHSPDTKRYYIQGVLLATIVVQYGTEIGATAQGVIGDTFGAKGKIYNQESTMSKDFRISLLTIDVDKLAQLTSGLNLLPGDQLTPIKASLADGFEVKSITGLNDLMGSTIP